MRFYCENHAVRRPKVPGKVCTVVPQVVPGAASEIAYRETSAAAPVGQETPVPSLAGGYQRYARPIGRTPVMAAGLAAPMQ